MMASQIGIRFDDTFRRLERFRGIVIAKLGSDYLPPRMFLTNFGFSFFHPLVLVGHRWAGIEESDFRFLFVHLMSGHLYQHAAELFWRPLIDIVRTALRLGIGIPG